MFRYEAGRNLFIGLGEFEVLPEDFQHPDYSSYDYVYFLSKYHPEYLKLFKAIRHSSDAIPGDPYILFRFLESTTENSLEDTHFELFKLACHESQPIPTNGEVDTNRLFNKGELLEDNSIIIFPLTHPIFMEICYGLDLDTQEIPKEIDYIRSNTDSNSWIRYYCNTVYFENHSITSYGQFNQEYTLHYQIVLEILLGNSEEISKETILNFINQTLATMDSIYDQHQVTEEDYVKVGDGAYFISRQDKTCIPSLLFHNLTKHLKETPTLVITTVDEELIDLPVFWIHGDLSRYQWFLKGMNLPECIPILSPLPSKLVTYLVNKTLYERLFKPALTLPTDGSSKNLILGIRYPEMITTIAWTNLYPEVLVTTKQG